YKSINIEDELLQANKAINVLGGELLEVKEVVLPDTNISRSVVIIKKRLNTPKQFPRDKNQPKTSPL
ncbi:MAG: 16S rRNA (guanine(527)-N(7))-methyltransferase RsmG, partial [Tenericutes bacterium HGW-Tenericutes-4]